MAGRKPTPKQDLVSMLLGKIGLAPAPKKRRRRKGAAGQRPGRPAQDSFAEAYAQETAAPFGEYGQESGLGFEGGGSYEAAAAAGFAPPPPPPAPRLEPLFPETPASAGPAPRLPNFYGESQVDAPAAVAAAAPAPGKLFSEEALDNSLDALFSGLELGTLPAEPVAAAVPVHEVSAVSADVPPVAARDNVVPFPLAVSEAPAPILPEAIAEVPEPAAAPSPFRPGAGPRPAARVLTLSQGTNLNALLGTIDRVPGVAGSLLVGHDGLIIAATLPPEIDREYLGAQACSLFAGSSQQLQKMRQGELRRAFLETESGAMLMTAADMGILVVVSQDGQAMDEAAVLAAISGALGRA